MLRSPRPIRPPRFSLTPPAAPKTPVQGQISIRDLDPVLVLVSLINVPKMLGLVDWAQLTPDEARRMLGDEGHLNLPQYQGRKLRLHITRDDVFTAAYDRQFGALRGARIVADLRAGRASHGAAPLWPLSADAQRFNPMGPVGSPPLTACALPRPVLSRLPSTMLPARGVMEARLRSLDHHPWYQRSLVPLLLGAAGRALTPNQFINFYYLALSLATDDDADPSPHMPYAARFLSPFDNPVLDVMLPVPWLRDHVQFCMNMSSSIEQEQAASNL